jgi:hypothetical protein
MDFIYIYIYIYIYACKIEPVDDIFGVAKVVKLTRKNALYLFGNLTYNIYIFKPCQDHMSFSDWTTLATKVNFRFTLQWIPISYQYYIYIELIV